MEAIVLSRLWVQLALHAMECNGQQQTGLCWTTDDELSTVRDHVCFLYLAGSCCMSWSGNIELQQLKIQQH